MKRTLLFIFCFLSAALFFIYIFSGAAKVTHGFASYYTFSRIMAEGKDLGTAYDTAYFNSSIRNYGIENVRDLPNNLPTNSLMLAPISVLPPVTAKVMWTALNVIFFIASIVLLLRIFEIKPGSDVSLLLCAVSFLFLPVYHGFILGQAYVFLLLLFTLSMYGIKNNNIWLISIPLALMITIKGYGLFPLLAFIVLRKWKAVFYVFLISTGIILITLPFTGVNAWNVYLNEILLKMSGNEYASNTAYQTVFGFIKHIFFENPLLLATVITFFAALTFIAVIVKKKPKDENGILLFYCAAISLNVIFAPLAEDYHYALLLPLVCGTGIILFNDFKAVKFESIIFVLSLILISIPFNYKGLNDASFPLILLAYPRLYGGIILILLSFRRIRAET